MDEILQGMEERRNIKDPGKIIYKKRTEKNEGGQTEKKKFQFNIYRRVRKATG